MTYTVALASNEPPKLVIVGCGGTGSLVAEGLCRLLINSNLTLMLADFDRVEPHNLLRQNFFAGEVGKFKSQVLAERLSQQYGRKIGYTVMPYERDRLRGYGRSETKHRRQHEFELEQLVAGRRQWASFRPGAARQCRQAGGTKRVL